MKVSVRMVMKSAAGYYVGRYCEEDGFVEPYLRETNYLSEEDAVLALGVGLFVPRSCMENNFAYEMFPDLLKER